MKRLLILILAVGAFTLTPALHDEANTVCVALAAANATKATKPKKSKKPKKPKKPKTAQTAKKPKTAKTAKTATNARVAVVKDGSKLTKAERNQPRLIYWYDDMAKTCLYGHYQDQVYSRNRRVGFKINAVVEYDAEDGHFHAESFQVDAVGIGLCHDKSELLILFKNGTTAKVWHHGFTCKTLHFQVPVDKLRASPIRKIRLTNGRSFESYTASRLSKHASTYWQRLLGALPRYGVPQRCRSAKPLDK